LFLVRPSCFVLVSCFVLRASDFAPFMGNKWIGGDNRFFPPDEPSPAHGMTGSGISFRTSWRGGSQEIAYWGRHHDVKHLKSCFGASFGLMAAAEEDQLVLGDSTGLGRGLWEESSPRGMPGAFLLAQPPRRKQLAAGYRLATAPLRTGCCWSADGCGHPGDFAAIRTIRQGRARGGGFRVDSPRQRSAVGDPPPRSCRQLWRPSRHPSGHVGLAGIHRWKLHPCSSIGVKSGVVTIAGGRRRIAQARRPRGQGNILGRCDVH
jgi:hypothetical protein